MHILITNDDGYQSKGINSLTKALMDRGHRVTVAAPDRERSAASHAISILAPLRAKEINVAGARGWAIDGSPADCARLGLHLTKDDRPDLCISGINRGGNLGGACIYSGTVNAAMEASMAGCPAIASSLNSFRYEDYTLACALTLKMVDYAAAHALRRGEIYNLNVPPASVAKGLFFTQILGPDFLTEANYQEFTSNYNAKYYYLDDGENAQYFHPDSDSARCRDGWATVSVLSWDIAAKRRDDMPQDGEMQL